MASRFVIAKISHFLKVGSVPTSKGRSMLAPFRILILEDDELLRGSMATVLEEEGYHVVAVGQGLEAVDQAQNTDFDLIVTDIRMAGIDGLDALAQVKESQPEICSMVVTGYSTEADSVRAIQLGVQEYLRKPFRLEQFLEGVRRLSGRVRHEQVVVSREKALTRTAVWGLEAVLRGRGETGPWIGLGRLAARTARELGLSPEESEECHLITLAGLIGRSPQVGDPGELLQSLPAAARHLLELASERWDGVAAPEGLKADEIPMAARIAAPLILFPEGPLAPLREKAPGAFDPKVLETLERMTAASSSSPTHSLEAAAASRRRSLLSLGSMLEEAGEVSSASRAYLAAAQGSMAPSRESAEALVGLSRLAKALGDGPRLQEFSRKALAMARQVSPTCLVNSGLQVAMLVESDEGGEILEEVLRLTAMLGQQASEARARLAFCYLRGAPQDPAVASALQVLTRPEHYHELTDRGAWWLLELLALRLPSDPSLDKVLLRIAREKPREAEKVLARPLEGPIRLLLAQALNTAPELAPLLKRFAHHPEVAQVLSQASGPVSPPELPTLRLLTLGPLEFYRGRERVPDKAWKTQKNRFFLACVASHGRPMSEDVLMEEFWPNDPATAKANLYSTLSNLRKALKPSYWPGAELEYVVRTKAGLQLNPNLPVWCDLLEFNGCLQEAQQKESSGQPDEAMQLRRQAVQLFRGPFLEGCYMEWANGYRSRVERLILEALSALAATCHVSGRHLEALEHSHRLLELDSCCQEGYRLAMLANLGLNRAEEAVRLYEACCKTLKRELAMEPSIAILEAHQRALLSLR